MVEINNQRKAFLDMLAWSEGTDNGALKRKSCRTPAVVEEYYGVAWSPSPQTCLGKTQINRRRTLPASFPLVGCLPQAAWPERLLSKSQDAVALQQIKERGALLWLIVVISVRQSTVAATIWASLPGAGYGQFEHKADSLIAKFKEAGGTVREIDVWAESPRLSPLWLSASSSACHGLLIITVITPLPTKPSATKMPENWSWRTRQLLTCRCVSVMLLRSITCKIHEELADAKAENDALRDDVAAGRRQFYQSSLLMNAWSHHRLRRG